MAEANGNRVVDGETTVIVMESPEFEAFLDLLAHPPWPAGVVPAEAIYYSEVAEFRVDAIRQAHHCPLLKLSPKTAHVFRQLNIQTQALTVLEKGYEDYAVSLWATYKRAHPEFGVSEEDKPRLKMILQELAEDLQAVEGDDSDVVGSVFEDDDIDDDFDMPAGSDDVEAWLEEGQLEFAYNELVARAVLRESADKALWEKLNLAAKLLGLPPTSLDSFQAAAARQAAQAAREAAQVAREQDFEDSLEGPEWDETGDEDGGGEEDEWEDGDYFEGDE